MDSQSTARTSISNFLCMGLLELTPEALPQDALDGLRASVAAATEPDRMGGGSPYHFTFWYSLLDSPRNAVELAVRDHLVHHVPAEVRTKAVGVEWWLGRLAPPYSTNFEFGLHRDFGENPATGALESPMLSSVLYLTSVDDGPLLVFGGRPALDSPDREHVFPQANLYAKFSGDLWHVIAGRDELSLEAPDTPDAPDDRLRLSVLVNWWPYRPSDEATEPMKKVAADYDGNIYPELAVPSALR